MKKDGFVNLFKVVYMAAFLTLSSSRTIVSIDYFPAGQQLFWSVVASLQHPPCSSFVPEQHLAPQHPPYIFFSLYIQLNYNHWIIKISKNNCNIYAIIIKEPRRPYRFK